MRLKYPMCGLEVDVPDDAISGEIVGHECGAALEVVEGNGSISLKPLEGVQRGLGRVGSS